MTNPEQKRRAEPGKVSGKDTWAAPFSRVELAALASRLCPWFFEPLKDLKPTHFALQIVLCAVVPMVIGGCAAPSSVLQNPDFAIRKQAIKTVAVVKPDVQIVRTSLGGGAQPLPDDDLRVSDQLAVLGSTEFSQHGFAVAKTDLVEADHLKAQSAYDQISYQQTAAAQHPSLSTTYSVGGEAASIAKDNKADGLVFITFEGSTRSGGSVAAEIAFDVLIAAGTGGMFIPMKQPNATAVLMVVFVDGKTGDVLWQNRYFESWGVSMPTFENPDLSKMMRRVFKKFPQ